MSDDSDEELNDNNLLRFVIIFLSIIAIAVGFYGFGKSEVLQKEVALLEKIIEQHGIVAPEQEMRK